MSAPQDHTAKLHRNTGRAAAHGFDASETTCPQALQPPSTVKFVPLMNPACGLARNATASAMSSGRPRRPTLVCLFIASMSGPAGGVRLGLNQCGLDVVDRDAPRSHIARPAPGKSLHGELGAAVRTQVCFPGPMAEDRSHVNDSAAARFCHAPAPPRTSWKAARTLRLKSRSKSSSVISGKLPKAKLPALLTSTSRRPTNRPANAPSICASSALGRRGR